MQNILRRPRGNSGPQRGNYDTERGGSRGDDEGVLSKGMRGHFVAMRCVVLRWQLELYEDANDSLIKRRICWHSDVSILRLRSDTDCQ